MKPKPASVVDRGEVLGSVPDVLAEASRAARVAASRCESALLPGATMVDHLEEAEQALTYALARVRAARKAAV